MLGREPVTQHLITISLIARISHPPLGFGSPYHTTPLPAIPHPFSHCSKHCFGMKVGFQGKVCLDYVEQFEELDKITCVWDMSYPNETILLRNPDERYSYSQVAYGQI